MDREEAREILKAWSTDDYPLSLIYEALDVAIEALKQTELKPSYNSIKTELDAISRQDAYKCLEFKGDYDTLNEAYERLSKLLPVSTEKTGRWISQDVHNCHTNFKCSECGYIHNFMHLYGKPTADYTYCPNCGAKMEEVEE